MRRSLLLFLHAGTLCTMLCGRSPADSTVAEFTGCLSAVRDCDTIWTVCTRKLSGCDPAANASAMSICVRDGQGQWQPADLTSFLATDDPAVTTIFWIHGNRYTYADAAEQGMTIYRLLTRCATCATPVRFVIFSWPSERLDAGPLKDLRVKAARTDAQCFYLAWLIDRIGENVPISLAGYSYGARIATGSAHLLGGGRLNGWTLLERAHPSRRPMRMALLAPALDNHWLVPGHHHGQAMSQIERLTVLYNSCDAALKRYRFLYCRKSDAQALGHTGVVGLNRMGAYCDRITQIDACCYVGRRHSWERYAESRAMMARVRAAVLLPSPDASTLVDPTPVLRLESAPSATREE